MREHAFIPNRDEADPAAGWTGLVGFSVPFVDESYFAVILSGAAEALYEQNQRVVLCPTYHQHDREVTLLDRLLGGTTDGALILLPEQSSRELHRLQEQGYPFVVIDPRQPLDDGIPVRLGDARRGRPGGDRAPAPARPSPGGADHRHAELGRHRPADRGVQDGAGGRPDPVHDRPARGR